MHINVARMLWAYNIEAGWDVINGKKVRTKVDRLGFYSGFNSPPLPFKAAFIPRQSNVPEILRREFSEAEKDTGKILRRIEEAQRVLKEGEDPVSGVTKA